MICPNCKHDAWTSVDEYRIKPAGMELCKGCGFISYPSKWKTPEEIKAHYRQAYRPPPTHNNIFTGQRKNHFHHAFLDAHFQEWQKLGNKKPKILEIGAAFGVSLNWFLGVYPGCEVYGTELTTSFRRNALREFGINLTEDFDESIKYDLIMSYKVLEHQLDPHIELQRYAKALAPGGRLYISVPTWFNTLTNFGAQGFDLEYYYDPNHINVWSKEIFESILTNNGFKIIKEDQVIYSSTYLCEVDPDFKNRTLLAVKDTPHKRPHQLDDIKNAYMAFTENRFDDAIKYWPDYPQAWISKIEMERKALTQIGWDEFKKKYIEAAMAACPTSSDIWAMATDFAMRAGQWDDGITYAEACMKMKPENPVSLNSLATIMRERAIRAKDPQEKIHWNKQGLAIAEHLRAISLQHWREATDLVMYFNAQLPLNLSPPKKNETPLTVVPDPVTP